MKSSLALLALALPLGAQSQSAFDQVYAPAASAIADNSTVRFPSQPEIVSKRQPKADRGLLLLSQVALAASAVGDALSSRGLNERNGLLGRGQFRMTDQGAKALAITGGVILVETLLVRKWPSLERGFRWTNWLGAGAHSAAAGWNGAQR